MQTENMILAHEFCMHHNVQLSFIESLSDFRLIEVTIIEGKIFIPSDQLCQIEKLVRLHFELGINLEGIETISHLLKRITTMQEQIIQLRNKVGIYNDE